MDSVQPAVVGVCFIAAISVIIFVAMPRIEKRRRSRESMKRVAEAHSEEDAVESYNSAWRYLREGKEWDAPAPESCRATPRIAHPEDDDYAKRLSTAIVVGEASSQRHGTVDASPEKETTGENHV